VNQGFEYRARLGADAAGLSVLDHLARRYPHASRDEWMRRLESGRVLIDGRPVAAHTILKSGQVLAWLRPPWEEPCVPAAFAILYRGPGLLAVAKPRGLPTIPGGGLFVDNTLLTLVRRHFPGASPLHRLGRATSGIVLFATTAEGGSALSRQWRGRDIVKLYRALVGGAPARDEWRVDTPIGPVPHPVLGTIHAASPVGKTAISDVKVLERRDGCAVVEVRITTGRPHQIRIHLAAAGHPLVGDPVYAVGGLPAPDALTLPGEGGYHLHAGLLAFADPVSGQWTQITCGPPPILRVGAKS
jgi:23S rRNA pseudouridine1911/1915/1917 synthase